MKQLKVRNVLAKVQDVVKVKASTKKSAALKLVRNITFATAVSLPSLAAAAGSPEGMVMNVLNGLTNLLLVIAPSAGGLALAWLGIQSYVSSDSHKKAELRDNMKSVGIITAIIMMATTIVKWIAELAS
jgi:hypothetical protein